MILMMTLYLDMISDLLYVLVLIFEIDMMWMIVEIILWLSFCWAAPGFRIGSASTCHASLHDYDRIRALRVVIQTQLESFSL